MYVQKGLLACIHHTVTQSEMRMPLGPFSFCEKVMNSRAARLRRKALNEKY